MPRRVELPCWELRRLYEDEGMSSVALACCYRCSPTTITKYLRACGATVRLSRFQARDIPADVLRHLYSVERLPIRDIAQRFGVSQSTIGNRRRALGIPVRSRTRT